MINFKDFLLEETREDTGRKLDHISHLEDLPLHHGHEGVEIAADMLDHVHKKLLGHVSSVHVSTKYDGSPSVVFGHHPQTGQFFIGTKSALNKKPKLNFSHKDIENNHPEQQGLINTLKAGFDHLPKIMPKHGGVYQGDMLYHKAEVKREGGSLHFQPNTISYSAPANSAHGKAIKHSQVGIAVHTKYVGNGKNLDNFSAKPLHPKERVHFASHPDVHNVDPTLKADPNHYHPKEAVEFMNHKENARATYQRMKPEALDTVRPHAEHLGAHINAQVRVGQPPSVDGYLTHLTNKHTKEAAKLKTTEGKLKNARKHATLSKEVIDNREHFDKALELHSHLQNAKNVLTRVMHRHSEFDHHIGGVATTGEGAVAVDSKGNTAKFVDRTEFSRQNFLRIRK